MPGFYVKSIASILVIGTIAWFILPSLSPVPTPLALELVLLATLLAPLALGIAIYAAYSPAKAKAKAAQPEVLTLDLDDDRNLETALTYYDYFRDEIKREDEITHQRVTWTMTFQGFLMSAVTLLLILDLDGDKQFTPMARLSLFAFGLIGIAVGLVSFMGILASRRSIKDAVDDWGKKDGAWKLQYRYVPQTHGQDNAFDGGNRFATLMPALFILMWTAFMFCYLIFSYATWMEPCADTGNKIRCMFIDRPADSQGISSDALGAGESHAD